MYNIYLRMRDEVERQVASLGKITCVVVMSLTSVYWTGVDSNICLLVTTQMTV